jgi:hypothetical protein
VESDRNKTRNSYNVNHEPSEKRSATKSRNAVYIKYTPENENIQNKCGIRAILENYKIRITYFLTAGGKMKVSCAAYVLLLSRKTIFNVWAYLRQ